MSDAKMTAEESCRQVLKAIADACDQESLARAGGYLFRYVQEETVLRDCGQRGVCRTPPGCARHWEERNRELVRENEVLRSNSDHLSSENASLARQVESMAMRIESLAEELAKPEDMRLREVLDALDGRAVIFDGLGARIGHLLDETDEWIVRAGEAERRADEYDAKLTAVRVALTEAGVPEVEPYPEEDVSDHEKSLRAGGRVIGAVARIERLVARLTAAGDVVKMARQLVSYDWEARLDDSKTSDAAKHDARELSYAVYEYDRAAKS